ncbi:PQQ-dependent sugar dehydrogenase [Halocynthiibacter sp. C4]|uniref:PQQ-dependent sugar dehydrogenase n=1 Tax=Halocynthiibacter sp. C4 TaxID=2992758 RepID=UPI00237B053E|nr:PQQ-dependent sugar dehydrogenase [Halocynthiibacter sp. C4]MDE0591511.1 PQQ-dependent sugar dehydrogenase [Halocynthiibacter sp. C4]
MIRILVTTMAGLLLSCGATTAQSPFELDPIATLDRPWAMTALPQGGFLVTEKAGRLVYVSATGEKQTIAGAPAVNDSGQVGLHDVALAPDFASSGIVYLTWVEGSGGGALRLGRGRLDLNASALNGFREIWRAEPTGGRGHPGAMIAFGPDGHLFLSSGDRQQGSPAQDISDSRGKILRLNTDGTPASGNPFSEAPDVWTLGHRNPYGLVFDESGRLWSHEMGPRGGDELNLITEGQNYGWPLVSEGEQYSGQAIPAHATRPEFTPPLIDWTPIIAPAGMIFYTGAAFPDWRGSLLLGGLASQALVRVEINANSAREVDRWELDNRIRDVAADNAGHVYVLEDGEDARLLRVVRGE